MLESQLDALYTKIWDFEHSDWTVALQSNSNDLTRNWFCAIYSDESGHIKVLGPIGERPLHVCAISVNRFEDAQFEGAGNYMKDGIIRGIKKILQRSEAAKNWMHSLYGKDYCAAVGHFMHERLEGAARSVGTGTWGETWSIDPETVFHTSVENGNEPPCWKELKQWYRRHTKQGKKASVARLSSRWTGLNWYKSMVTTGMFEGESILLQLIAAGDCDTIYWLLDAERHWSRAEWGQR